MGVIRLDLGSIATSTLAAFPTQEFPRLRGLERGAASASKTRTNPDAKKFAERWLRGDLEVQNVPEARMVCESTSILLSTQGNWANRMADMVRSDRMDRKCWYLLVLAYFQPGFDSKDSRGLEQLRELLEQESRRYIPSSADGTRWQKAIKQWPEILQPDADTLFFSRKALTRKDAEQLLGDIGAGSDSRFYQSLILRDVRELVDLDGARFHGGVDACLDALLAQGGKHERIVRVGLAMLLERFAKEPGAPPCMKLKEAVLLPRYFGHPSIVANAPRWAGVSPEAKAMLTRWVSRWDLEHFFEVLDSQGKASKDRLRFWRKYIDQMTGTQIVFGIDADSNITSGFRSLRDTLKREGRYCRLANGDSDNNAFVFRIKGHTFVEFGAHGKGACYVYPPDELPPGMPRFELKPPIHVSESALKARQAGDDLRWIHAQGWEDRFAYRIKILENRSHEVPKPTPPSSVAPAATSQPVKPAPVAVAVPRKEEPTVSTSVLLNSLRTDAALKQFREWTSANGVELEDLRHKQGALWARSQNKEASRMLIACGFLYSDKREAFWYR